MAALLRRRPAGASSPNGRDAHKEPSGSAKKQPKAEKKHQAKPDKLSTVGSGSMLWRRALGLLALLAALVSAASEWPIYLAYEKDWRRPALGFSMNLSITAVIALLVCCSPPVRALKPRTNAPASQPMPKQMKTKIATCCVLILMGMWYGFGAYGPSGALTTAALCTFGFFTLP